MLARFTSIRDRLVKSSQSNYIGCCTLTGNDVTLHTVVVQLIVISLTDCILGCWLTVIRGNWARVRLGNMILITYCVFRSTQSPMLDGTGKPLFNCIVPATKTVLKLYQGVTNL